MTFQYPEIFNNDDSYDVAYGKILFRWGFFRSLLCRSFPAQVRRGDSDCKRNFNTRRCRKGSVAMDLNVDASGFSSASDASSAMTSMTVPGVNILSSSATAQGLDDSSTSSTNLGLILGVSIPLGILRNSFLT